MKLFGLSLVLFAVSLSYGQTCADQWQAIFEKRGAYNVQDDMHRDVIIYIEENGVGSCYNGKARVELGKVVNMLVQLENGEYNTVQGEFANPKGNKPGVENGMSEWIVFKDGKKAKVFFKSKIKPKEPQKQEAISPEEWLESN